MELSEDEIKVQAEAVQEIEDRKEELIMKFIKEKNPLHLGVISFFMAGSPGSGKTEFSQRYMPLALNKKDPKIIKELLKKGINIEEIDTLFIRIDVDEIREFLSQYKKTDKEKGILGNSHVVQQAANHGLDIIRNYCFQEHISFLHDGTFSNLKTMRKLIKKSLKYGRKVQIFYLYIDPLIAWGFTKAREFLEGRNIIKEKFIEQFFSARENVDIIKKEFEKQVQINCVVKDENCIVSEIEFNVESIDNFLKKRYNSGALKNYTPEDLQGLIC